MNNSNTRFFANKRARLKAEMDVAEELLKDNLQDFDLLDYLLPTSTEVLPAVKHVLKEQPASILVPLKVFTKQFLSKDHWIHRVLSLLNALGFLLK